MDAGYLERCKIPEGEDAARFLKDGDTRRRPRDSVRRFPVPLPRKDWSLESWK